MYERTEIGYMWMDIYDMDIPLMTNMVIEAEGGWNCVYVHL